VNPIDAIAELTCVHEPLADALIAAGDLFWLVDGGEIVSMAGCLRRCFTGISIAYAYTPP